MCWNYFLATIRSISTVRTPTVAPIAWEVLPPFVTVKPLKAAKHLKKLLVRLLQNAQVLQGQGCWSLFMRWRLWTPQKRPKGMRQKDTLEVDLHKPPQHHRNMTLRDVGGDCLLNNRCIVKCDVLCLMFLEDSISYSILLDGYGILEH